MHNVIFRKIQGLAYINTYVRIELVKLIWKFIMYLSLKLKLHTMFTITKALIELRAILNKKCCLDWLTSYTQIGRRVMLQNWEKCETLVLHTYEKSLSLGVSRGQLIIMEECCRSLALTWIFIQHVLRIHLLYIFVYSVNQYFMYMFCCTQFLFYRIFE